MRLAHILDNHQLMILFSLAGKSVPEDHLHGGDPQKHEANSQGEYSDPENHLHGEILRSMRLTVKVSLLAIEHVMVKTALQTAKAESFARTFRWEAGC